MADPNNDPFAASGGGVYVNGGWVPKSHPLAQQAGGGAAATGTTGTPQQQAQNASTYSGTPGAAPLPNTTNQGSQDVVRNTYLQQATQGATTDRFDPNVRAQADAYGANVDRSARDYIADAAEKMGPYATGALQGEKRLAAERAGQAKGGFEAQLVGREIQARRQEISEALSGLRGMISQDQAMALQRELAQLDAQLKQAGIDLGYAELGLRGELGRGDLDLRRQHLGFNMADREAYWNNAALQYLM